MQEVSSSVQINMPIETVFGALCNVQNNVHWIKSVVSVELIDELPLREGFRFRETGGFLGVHVTDEKRVTAYARPNLVKFTGDFLDNSTQYGLKQVNVGQTVVTVTLTGTAPRGTPAIVQRRVLKQAVKRMTEDLTRLGQLLEK